MILKQIMQVAAERIDVQKMLDQRRYMRSGPCSAR